MPIVNWTLVDVAIETSNWLPRFELYQLTLTGGNAPMQVDGEPWEQHAGTITVEHHNQVTMLSKLDLDD